MKKAHPKGRIGVLMGGLSSEREISLRTGGAVLKALLERGHDAVGIDAGRDLPAVLKRKKIEVVFIALHGRYGEDGCVQGLLEVIGLPYTGSGVRSSAVAMDKAAAKKIFACHGVSTPASVEYAKGRPAKGLKFPLVVKPSSEGSTIGVTIVRKKSGLAAAINEAQRYGAVMIEEFVEGRELTVSVLNGRVLPVIEIRPKEGFYDYANKYTKGRTDFIVPAPLKKAVLKAVERQALLAYECLGCSGAARVDIMLDRDETPFVLEVNTIPGMTELSLLPRAAEAAGISYQELVEEILSTASAGKF